MQKINCFYVGLSLLLTLKYNQEHTQEESRLVMTFLTNSFYIVIVGKAGEATLESSRLEFLEKIPITWNA